MENATDALKMAASVLIFVGALSLAMFSLTRAKQASTSVMSAGSVESYYDIELNQVTSVREVGLETIIPNLYSYYKNYNTILFYTGNWNSDTKSFDGDIKPLCLYYTEALGNTNSSKYDSSALGKSILKIDNSREIYGLDINDERTRQEPWVFGDNPKAFVDSLIQGDMSPEYTWSRAIINQTNEPVRNTNQISGIDYSRNSIKGIKIGFQYKDKLNGKTLQNASNARFIERIGRYNYKASKSTSVTDNGQVQKGETKTASSQINLSNGESIENNNDVEKTVIQYIYIGDK